MEHGVRTSNNGTLCLQLEMHRLRCVWVLFQRHPTTPLEASQSYFITQVVCKYYYLLLNIHISFLEVLGENLKFCLNYKD